MHFRIVCWGQDSKPTSCIHFLQGARTFRYTWWTIRMTTVMLSTWNWVPTLWRRPGSIESNLGTDGYNSIEIDLSSWNAYKIGGEELGPVVYEVRRCFDTSGISLKLYVLRVGDTNTTRIRFCLDFAIKLFAWNESRRLRRYAIDDDINNTAVIYQ